MRTLILLFVSVSCFGQVVSMAPLTSSSDYNSPISSTEAEESQYDIIFTIDFEHWSTGAYTKTQVETEFGDTAYNVNYVQPNIFDIVTDTIYTGVQTKVMRIRNIADELYHGFGALLKIPPLDGSGDQDSAYQEINMTWNMRFGTEWYLNHGGKLGGFQGIPDDNQMGPANPRDGYGARASVNFDEEGVYDYHYDQTEANSPWSSLTGIGYEIDTVFLGPGDWHVYDIRVVNNSTPSLADGIYELWVDHKMIVQIGDMKFYDDQGSLDTIAFNGFDAEHYYGGDGPTYMPWIDLYGFFDNYTIYKDTADSKYGLRELHTLGVSKVGPLGLPTNNEFYVDTSFTEGVSFVDGSYTNTSADTCKTNQYLVDGGAGNTVTFDITLADEWGGSDNLLIYDGNTIGSDLIFINKETYQDNFAANTDPVTSSDRYMYVRVEHYCNGAYNTLTATITINE